MTMMSKMGKISYVQLAVMLILCRVFASAMSFPAEAPQFGMQRFTVIVCAKILLCILFLPLFFIARKYEGESFLTIAIGKSKALGWVFGVIYGFTLLCAAIISVVKFEYYTSSTIMNDASAALLVSLLILVCLYGAYKGVEAMGRTGSIILAMFGVFLGLMIISLWDKMNFVYLYGTLIDNGETFWSEVITELSRNSEVLLFGVLAQYVRQKAYRAVYVYIAAIAFVILIFAFMTMTVLGPYMNSVSFPIYTLSSMSDIVLFHRLDGIDVGVWVLAVIVKVTLYAAAFQTAAYHLVSEKAAKFAPLVFLAAVGIAGWYFSENKDFIIGAKGIFNTGIPLIICGFVLPLISLCIAERRKHEKTDMFDSVG